MKAHFLLFAMLFSYLIPIYMVYSFYKKGKHNNSISSIISESNLIFGAMIVMGIFTILYEHYRNDYSSMFYILLLLIGIYGVIRIKETELFHYVFASLVFISIMLFMRHHCRNKQCPILYTFFSIQTILFVFLGYFLYKKSPYFFHIETLLLLNFAIYYFYLHYLEFIC